MITSFKSDKGVAGLTILLSLIVMLFVIGLLVMIFAIMGGKMADTDSLYYRTGTTSAVNETISASQTGTDTAVADYRSVVCSTTGQVINASGNVVIAPGNYTLTSACSLSNSTCIATPDLCVGNWKVSYTYTYLIDSSGAVSVINDTTTGVAGVTDWFDIFIVIGAMVVLILLTVIIITAIRSSGMVQGQTGKSGVGTA